MEKKAKKTNKNEKDKKKKRRIALLATLIPLGVAGAATGIVFGVKACQNKSNYDIEIAESEKSEATIKSQKTTAKGLEIEIASKLDEKKVESIESVVIGEQTLTKDEFEFKDGVVIIHKDALEKYKGKIVIKPVMADRTLSGVEITIDGKVVAAKKIKVNQTINIKATAKYEDAQITWTSSDPTVIATPTTSSSGSDVQITGLKKGTTKLTATCADKSTFCDFTVEDDEPVATSVKIASSHNADIGTGEFTCKAVDENGNDISGNCTWEIKDETLAKFVDNVLTFESKAKSFGGSTTITATRKDTGDTTGEFPIEIATFDKLKADGSAYSLQNGYANKKDETVTGDVVTPTQYYIDGQATPKQITSISASGMNAEGIESVFISKTINSMGSQVFGPGLKAINVDSENTTFTSPEISNCIIRKSAPSILAYGCAGSDLTKLPSTVTKIGYESFYNSGLTTISILDTITEIEGKAFYKCGSLKTVEIGQGVTVIKDEAFEDCSKLDSFTFTGTSAITEIQWKAFANCTSLSKIELPASIEQISNECFLGCKGTLSEVKFADTSKDWIQTNDTAYSNKLDITDASENAKHFTDFDPYPEYIGYNWGETGIKIPDSGTNKSAIVTYDEEGFKKYQIDISGSTSWVVSRTEEDSTIKIKYDPTKLTSTVEGKVTIESDKQGKTVIQKNVKFDPATYEEPEIVLADAQWANISPQDTLTVSFVESKEATIDYSTWSCEEIELNGTKCTSAISKGTVDTIKVVGTAKTSATTGTIKVYNGSYSQIIALEKQTFSTDETEIDIELDEAAWSQIENGSELYIVFEEDTHVNVVLGTIPELECYVDFDPVKTYGTKKINVQFSTAGTEVTIPASTYKIELVGGTSTHTEYVVIDRVIYVGAQDPQIDVFQFNFPNLSSFTDGETVTLNIISNT